MGNSSRVPETIPEFNTYINDTDDRLQAINPDTTNPYWQDYGLTTQNKTDWNTKRLFWKNILYPKYSNPLTSTSVVKEDVRDFMESFRTFANPLLDKIEVSSIAGNAEEAIFNFTIGRAAPTRPTEPIQDTCIASIKGIMRGMTDISCRATEDSKRASIPESADSVLYSFAIVNTPEETIINPDDSRMKKNISTRASFTLDLGAENQGKWVIIYFRWNLVRYPQFAGPWSEMHKLAIG